MNIAEERMPFFMDGYEGDDSAENGSNNSDSCYEGDGSGGEDGDCLDN